ncbi:hypothetical protein GGI12_002460, partial [Dipsacomyces acuminosporus]
MSEALSALPALAGVLEHVEIASTADLTRALRGNSLSLQQRLALAHAVFDSKGAGDAGSAIRRLSAILVRKNELLADWLFSTMLRGLKTTKPDQYAMHKDVSAIRLLLGILEAINNDMGRSGLLVEVRTVLQRSIMPLFMSALDRQLSSSDVEYIAAITDLWQFVAESSSDGVEMLCEHVDQLARLLASLVSNYLETSCEPLRTTLSNIISSVCVSMRGACETTSNAPKLFTLVCKELLLPLLRLSSLASAGDTRSKVLDLVHASLFHPSCMHEFVSSLQDRSAENQQQLSEKYTNEFFDLVSSALKMKDKEIVSQYASALPELFARFLQSSTLICSETRSQAASTLGLLALTANPLNVTQVATSSFCFRMFNYLYELLLPIRADERVLGAINSLVRVYFTDPCFGTTNNASIVRNDVYQQQIKVLNSWLSSVISPVLISESSPADAIAVAFDGIDLALDAAPDSVLDHGAALLEALSHVPNSTVDQATKLQSHLVSNLTKARQLGSVLEKLTEVDFKDTRSGTKQANLLVSAPFIQELNSAVSQSMPFAQASGCLSTLVNSICAAVSSQPNEESSSKRRRLNNGKGAGSGTVAYRVGVLAALTANFVLSSAGAVNTEHQRVLYRKSLSESYEALLQSLSAAEFVWERLLLHYAFMEVASRIDSTEQWMQACMSPERVQQTLMPGQAAKQPCPAISPRVQSIAMLAAFQAAAHWSVYVSSLSAGIASVPAATDMDKATNAVQKMISDIFADLDMHKAAKSSTADITSGWADWDGQPHTISDENYMSAQWKLLSDWLELVCEYAHPDVVQSIASLIIAEMASSSSDAQKCSHQLLQSASFFEVSRIRKELLPALARFAASTWRAQALDLKKSKAEKVSQHILGILDQLATMDAHAIKAQLLQDIVDKIIGTLDLASSKQKPFVGADQANVWIQLLRSMLRFPTEYWTADSSAHAVFALALLIDVGVAGACKPPSAAANLRILCRELLERLVKALPSLLSQLAQHSGTAVDYWITTACASPSLVLHSRRLIYLTTSALCQSAFGQSAKTADKACRELMAHLYKKTFDGKSSNPLVGALALEAFGAISKAAKQYAKKIQSDGKASRKWMKLVNGWIGQASAVVNGFAARGDQAGDAAMDEHATCALGTAISLNSLRHSFASAESQEGSSDAWRLGKDAISAMKKNHAANRLSNFTLGRAFYTTGSSRAIRPSLQSLVALATDTESADLENLPLSAAIVRFGIESLLSKISAPAFEQAFVAYLKLAQQPHRFDSASVNASIAAFIRVAYKQGSASFVDKRKAIQRRLGSILTVMHSAMCNPSSSPSVDAVASALTMVDSLVLEPYMRFTVFDISEALSTVSSAVSLSLNLADGQQQSKLAALYKLVCKILSGIVRYHTNDALEAIALLVDILRPMLHAFVAPCAASIDAASTPWIVAFAPFPADCAEAYARVINDLVKARRFSATAATAAAADHKKGSDKAPGETKGQSEEYVKLTRGTNAASAASVLGLFAPNILAEYCIIQGGGKLSAVYFSKNSTSDSSASYRFQGLCWQPVPVLATSKDKAVQPTGAGSSGSAIRGIISDPALREALLPGWHALLDVMSNDNRNSLLTLLAGSSADDSRGWVSVFGPGRYGGANEIL